MDTGAAGEIISVIGGMATATKAVAEAVKTVRTKVKGNKEAEKILSDVFEQVLSLQFRMMDLQTTVLSLQQENAQLHAQLRREQERSSSREHYQHRKVGRATVLVDDRKPGIYYCPNCFESKHEAIPLQGLSEDFEELGTHRCFACDTYFQIQ